MELTKIAELFTHLISKILLLKLYDEHVKFIFRLGYSTFTWIAVMHLNLFCQQNKLLSKTIYSTGNDNVLSLYYKRLVNVL